MDIHCKVLYGEEYRRFVIQSAHFNVLFSTVTKLFNLPDGCSLKYKDDEGDLVTMSSDEELLSALEFSSGLLHLIVANPSQPTLAPASPWERNWRKHPHHRWGNKGCKREKKWEKKWEKKCHKRKNHPRNPEMLKKRIFWLTKKRDEFQARAKEIESILVTEGLLPDNLQKEQQVIEKKLNGISARLEKLTFFNSEIEASKGQPLDPETLPDISLPKVELSEEEKQKLLQELSNIRENLFKSCALATKEAKLKMKFCRSALDNFEGDRDSEEGRRLFQEWEFSRSTFKENRKVVKSLLRREEELCGSLGLVPTDFKVLKKMCKKEKKFSKHCNKKFKHHK